MKFITNNIDKIQLIQAIYIHANPKGFGEVEYKLKEQLEQNVVGLTVEQCQKILDSKKSGSGYLIDYLNGKPLKLEFYERGNGQVLVSSSAYDLRNGKFRFFEAMLNTFSLDEILIAQKSYSSDILSMINEHSKRPKSQNKIFENILKNTIRNKDDFGTYWKINLDKVSYIPPYMI